MGEPMGDCKRDVGTQSQGEAPSVCNKQRAFVKHKL